jgi:peroxiredoxin (alkyl hydroperoxide reductase subunit C)
VEALQIADAEDVVTPANWVPGMAVVKKPPKTYEESKTAADDPQVLCCMDCICAFQAGPTMKGI